MLRRTMRNFGHGSRDAPRESVGLRPRDHQGANQQPSAARSDVPIDAFLHWKETSMRRGVAMAALVGGFVAATTLPAAAQYVGFGLGDPGWGGGGVGVSIGFGAPAYYGGYAYPSYYAAAPAAYPSYYAAEPVYAYSGPPYGAYGYFGVPAYSYDSTTIYEPGY